jgi:8-oxo-dGTP pyrophosphatase MutT (NUDIX family)
VDEIRELVRINLDPLPHAHEGAEPARGDFDLNPHLKSSEFDGKSLKAAAVLVPLVVRPQGLSVLLTERSEHMPSHAGQVSFPGGRVQEEDASPVATALRETHEEVGVSADFIEPVGKLEFYQTGTGFRISPIVAFVRPGFGVVIDPSEVKEVFEAPFDFLMNPENHERHNAVWRGQRREYYAMPYDGHYIWGATAGILVNLYDRLFR